MLEDKSILLNTEIVKAILDGKKLVTKTVITPRYRKNECGWHIVRHKVTGDICCLEYTDENGLGVGRYLEPPYYPNDIIYVKEAVWQKVRDYLDVDRKTKTNWYNEFKYLATDEEPETGWSCWVKHPSIYMPKEAAQIWLKVTEVKVEILQDIIETERFTKKKELNKYGWDVDTYAWVIEFERCEKPKQEVQ